MKSGATYVYCLVRRARKPPLKGVPPGLPEAMAPTLHALGGGVWLVTAQVPLDRYGEAPLQDALRDLDWVGSVAVTHDAVVEHFARVPRASVIPMKLFTMFSSDDRALAGMGAKADDLARVFDHIEGCEEWGIRVVRNQDVPKRQVPAEPVRSGAAFLAARRQARDDARAVLEAAAEAADDVYASLAGLARDGRRRVDGSSGSTGALLDAAFLVPSGKRATFHAAAKKAARRAARQGALVTLTGPWPAYSFVGVEKPA
jgi:hypothetical protein